LLALEYVLEGRHTAGFASPSEDDGFELMMGFGGGVSQIGNPGARDGVYAMTIEAVLSKEDSAFVNGGWRGVHRNCGRRRPLMAEARNIKFGVATKSRWQIP
jgi:hypothetical protein